MKKQFRTTADQSAAGFDVIYFSAGRIGFQVAVAPRDLKRPLTMDLLTSVCQTDPEGATSSLISRSISAAVFSSLKCFPAMNLIS